MIVFSDRICIPGRIMAGYIQVDAGIITSISSQKPEVDEVVVDYSGKYIIPGIFDTHNHGTMGYSVIDATITDKSAEVIGYLKGCASQGITSVFPTADASFFKSIKQVSLQPVSGAQVLGIHSEGPYLNRVGEHGVSEATHTVDLSVLADMIADADGLLKLVALAPELDEDYRGIHFLQQNGIKVAYAHSDDTYAQAMIAFDQGISVATHTANVMSGIHHRDMGGLGACLLHPNVQCEVICDGIHVSPEMLSLMFKVKSREKWMMISDCTPASGAPQGTYVFSGMRVIIDEQGFCKTETGRLMGSTKPVVYGMKVLADKLGYSLPELVQLSSLNPAKFYGFAQTKGSIEVGKDADLVVLDPEFAVLHTYVRGIHVYDKQEGVNYFNPNFLK